MFLERHRVAGSLARMHAIGMQKSGGLSHAECATIATMNLRSYQSRVLAHPFWRNSTMTVRRSIYALVVILILLVAYVLLVR